MSWGASLHHQNLKYKQPTNDLILVFSGRMNLVGGFNPSEFV